MFWQAPYLYVSRGNAGLTIVNTSDVSNPYVEKTIPTSQLGGFNVGPVFALGNELFLSSMETTAGFSILNIDDPLTPLLVKTVSRLPERYYSSCWDGTKAYFGARSAGDNLRVYDTTTNPMTLLSDSESGFVNLYCNVQDDKLFLGNQDDISVLDVSDLNNISIDGTGSLDATGSDTDHGQVFAFGNMVWVGNDHGSGSGLIARQAAPDNTPPEVVRTMPASAATNQARTSRVGVALSDSVLMESVNSNTFTVTKIGSSTPVSGTYSVNLGFVHFTPDSQFDADGIYTVTLSGIEDFAGNAMPAYSWSFSTGDTAGHSVSSSVPNTVQVGSSFGVSASASPINNGTIEYSWDFGDGSEPTAFSTNGSASHTYTAPGHWTPIVTIRESGFKTTQPSDVTAHYPVTSTAPVSASSIVVAGSRVVSVNEDNDTVTAISANAPYGKLWETKVAERPRTVAVAPNGNLWVTAQDGDVISVLSPTGSRLSDIPLPRASQPYGVAFPPNGEAAYVTLQATGELLMLDPVNGDIWDRVTVGHSARGIAIDADSDVALVTRFISPQTHAEVIEVDIGSMTINDTINLAKDTTTIDGPDRSRGVPNYLNSVTISPDGRTAWVPSNKTNVDRGAFNENQPITFETTVRAILSQIDLQTGQEIPANQLDMDNRAQPKAVAFSALGDYTYTAIEGQNSVEIRDAYSRNRVNELVEVGQAPIGLARAGDKLFVHGFLSRSISVFDVSDFEQNGGDIQRLAETSTVANEKLHPRVLAGKQIFHNAADARMTQDGYLSCASCHAGGDSDGRVWDFTDRGEGLRNTIALLGRAGMGNGRVHWTANFDEIQDFENDIRFGFGGRGFIPDPLFDYVKDPLGNPKAGISDDLDNLSFYVSSLTEYPRSPKRNQNGTLTSDAQAGAALFTQKGCAGCHSGDFYTDTLRHDVGTIQSSSGQGISQPLGGVGFDTPTLIGLVDSAPYFHNGQAATLDDVLQTGSQHTVSSATERAQLVAYLEQIEYEGPEIVAPAPPPAPSYDYLSDLAEVSSTNQWGPIEKDQSNGEQGAGDGSTIRIDGTSYEKGLGVHAYSEVVYSLTGKDYDQFSAIIGVDDETGDSGSVVFEVYVDDVLSYQSSVLRGNGPADAVILPLTSANSELKLVVKDGGNGVGHDHADWADAKLRVKSTGTNQPGLYYGEVSGNINTTDANPKTSVTTNLSETEDAIGGNTTEIYTGYIYDADGNISFREYIDDKTRLWIDGELVLSSDLWSDVQSTGNLNLPPGWHAFELRISNGNGGSGPTSGIGFAFDPDGGTNWQHPEDPGDGSLFRTANPGTGTTQYVFASDLTEVSSTNGWGSIEKDRSNGEQGDNDGGTLTIAGNTFDKGLGVHASSEIVYQFTAGSYDQFTSAIGIDDEVGDRGSVIFKVFIDGVEAYQSGVIRGADGAESVIVSIPASATELKLEVTGAGDGIGHDHADWADAKFRVGTGGSGGTTRQYDYASDLSESASTNGWGPIEKDRSNGEQGATDGNTITIGGQTYTKGLGVHALSSVVYDFTAGTYDLFTADIGIDDEVGSQGSVVFVINVGGSEVYRSSTLRGSDGATEVSVAIPSGATQLTLSVESAGDGVGHDHADWADAKFRRAL